MRRSPPGSNGVASPRSALAPSRGKTLSSRRSLASPWRSLALVLLVLGCARRPAVDEDGGGARLMRNLELAREIEVIVEPGTLTDACQRRAAARGPDEPTYRVRAPGDAHDPRAPRIVVGTYATRLARALAARIEIATDEERGSPYFHWRDQRFGSPTDALVATFEDPDRPGLPLSLFYGNDERFLARHLGDLEPGWKPSLRLYRAGALIVEAPLRLSGELIEDRVARPGQALVEILSRTRVVATSEPGLLLRVAEGATTAKTVAQCAALVARVREHVRRWAAPAGSAPPLMVFVYADVDDFARLQGPDVVERVNAVDRGVHMLVGASLPHAAGVAIAEASALLLLEVPVEAWLLDGAAVDAAGVWWGRPLESWAGWLAASGLAPSAAELVSRDAPRRFSPHLVVPLRAVLFRELRAARGDSYVRQLWRGTERLLVDAALEQRFARALAELAERGSGAFDEERARRRSQAALARLHGVVIEQPGAPCTHGFGSAGFRRALDATRALGADAVLLPSFLVDEAPPPAHAGGPERPPVSSVEGDARIAAAASSARAAGLSVVIEPHLLSAPGGSWSGAWPRRDEPEWRRFFERYERFVVHYALLAELCGATAMSIGSGLSEVTSLESVGRRARPEDAVSKRAGWERVIEAARGGFAGALTYWAGSIDEAQAIGFWSDLDAIGLDVRERFEPRGALDVAGEQLVFEARLHLSFGPLAELAAAHDRPVLVQAENFAEPVQRRGGARVGPGSRSVEAGRFTLQAHARQWATLAAEGRLSGVFLARWSTDPACEAASAAVVEAADELDESVRAALTSW